MYDYIFDRITNGDMSDGNKRIARKFFRFCMAEGLCPRRMQRLVDYLLKLDALLPCDYDGLNRTHAETLWAKINAMDEFSDWTKYTFKCAIRKFYRWMGEGYLKHIAFKNRIPKTTILPQDLLSPEEIEAIIGNASNLEMRAIYSILYETGARINEVLSLKPGDIMFDDFGTLMTLRDKKTKTTRIVRVVEITDFLRDFTGRLPKDEKIFRKSYNTYFHRHIITLEKSGITKHVKFHLFRHTRASYLGRFLPE